MSRHILDTKTPAGAPVRVAAGWDRPLAGFFLTIERLDVKADDEDRWLYNNLDFDEPHPRSFRMFATALRNLGINLPESMLAEIIEDRSANAGNKCVRWAPDGQRGIPEPPKASVAAK